MKSPNNLTVRVVADTKQLNAGLAESEASVTAYGEAVNKAADSQTARASEQALQSQAMTTAQVWAASRRQILDAEDRANTLLRAGRKADAASAAAALDELDARRDAFLAASRSYYDSLDGMRQRSFAEQEAAANKEIELTYQRIAARLDAAAAVQVDTDALAANSAALTFDASAQREATYTLGEALTGRYGRLETTVFSLGARTGIMAKLFSPLGLAIGGAAAALGAFTYAVIQGERQSGAFDRALLATGDAAGVTEGQFDAMARKIATGDTTIGTARKAMLTLAQSGRFTGASLEQAARATVDFADLTGASMKQAARAVESLAQNPVRALVKLNDAYHFVTTSEYEHVQQLVREGHATAAARLAVDEFASAMRRRAAEAQADEGIIVRGWEDVKHAVDGAWRAVERFGSPASNLDKRIADLKAHLAEIRQGDVTSMAGYAQGNPAAIESEIKRLELKKQNLAEQVKQKAEQDRINAAGVHAVADLARLDAQAHTRVALLQQERRLTQDIEALHRAHPTDSRLAGDIFGASGNLQKGNAYYDSLLRSIQNRFSTHPIQLHFESTSQAEGAIRAADRTLNQLVQIQTAHAAATQQIMRTQLATRTQTLDAEVAAGRVSAASALEIERQLTRRLYAQDVIRLEEERSTLDSRPVEYARISDRILEVKAREIEALGRLDNRYAHAAARVIRGQVAEWQKAVGQIEGAESSLVSNIINKRQGLGRDLLHMTAQFITREIQDDARALTTRFALHETAAARQKALEQGGYLYHLISETQKTAATVAAQHARTAAEAAGATTRLTASAAARKEGAALESAFNIKEITSAAATAAAKAYKALAGIPIIGPELGAVAAAGTFVAVEAYKGMASMDVGAWNVPNDMVAQIHRNEMVIPATFAEGLRRSGGLGEDSGGVSIVHNGDIHIHDSDVEAMLALPAARVAVIGAIGEAIRSGYRP